MKLLVGDCLELLKELDDNSVDSVVTDPPYHLTTGKAGKRGFMGKDWDGGNIAHRPELWAEVLRVLKPGGHLLSFAGTRTYHRMTCAIEDAGFEIRDTVGWCFGSGFPKSRDISKDFDNSAGEVRELMAVGNLVKRMIPGADQDSTGSWIKDNGREYQPGTSEPISELAKLWRGWGTALKPAWEMICLARKPLIGTVATNVEMHGTGAINIDGCRVGDEVRTYAGMSANQPDVGTFRDDNWIPKEISVTVAGRFPANLIHDGSDEVLDAFARFGEKTSGARAAGNYGFLGGDVFSRHPVAPMPALLANSGSAARFFYCAKSSKKDRNAGLGDNANDHPTVKPTDLMRYLCRLITPPGGTVLDPFVGSGSTGRAAVLEGFDFIGMDLSVEYIEIARNRIAEARATARKEARASL